MEPNPAHVQLIYRQVLSYLVRCPEAGDTIEGITRLWLLDQRMIEAVADVQGAVDQLVADQLVRELRGPDGRAHYRFNPEMLAAAIKKLAALAQAQNTSNPGFVSSATRAHLIKE